MKKFIQDNPTIAYGLGLPLVLVVIFLVVSGLPRFLVADPQYEVLYATDVNNYPNVVQIAVVNQKVQVIYQGSTYGYQRPRLWRYNPKTGGVQEIAIVLPPQLESNQTTTEAGQPIETIYIDVPDVANLVVDSSSVAPDGYEFSNAGTRYSRSLFGGLFYSNRYRNGAILVKDGRSVRLPNSTGTHYTQSTQLIGWILPQ